MEPSPLTLSWTEARSMWGRIGLLSFGGPAGQIALMHREVVEQRQLVSEADFLNALNFCMLLPGPEAMQLATYLGWRQQGVKGGLLAGLLFILPGAVVLYVLSTLYVVFGKLPLVESFFLGIKAAVLVIVLEALLKVGRRALKGGLDYAIAAAAFVALFAFDIPFPAVILVAAGVGYFMALKTPASAVTVPLPLLAPSLRQAALWLGIWLLPLVLLNLVAPGSVYAEMGNFFAKLAVVTFGGAYAVLSYMGQQAVEAHHWLSTPQMIDGLGLAETTPGPLILVGQFVGFMAGHHSAGTLAAGFLGGLVFLWMTFAPCFLWIFAGGPYVEYLRTNPRFASALARVTAAVAGVILNLSLWFALHVFFGSVARRAGFMPVWWPVTGTISYPSLVIAVVAGFALLRFHLGMVKTLALAGAMGILWQLALPLAGS